MAQLKETTVNGNLTIKNGTIFGNVSGNATSADELNTDAGVCNQTAVYFSGGKPVAFTCTFGSAAWLDSTCFASAKHEHTADCIIGGEEGQVLKWVGNSATWANMSSTPYADCAGGLYESEGVIWKPNYGPSNSPNPDWLVSWNSSNHTLNATSPSSLCVKHANSALTLDNVNMYNYLHGTQEIWNQSDQLNIFCAAVYSDINIYFPLSKGTAALPSIDAYSIEFQYDERYTSGTFCCWLHVTLPTLMLKNTCYWACCEIRGSLYSQYSCWISSPQWCSPIYGIPFA